MRLHDILRARAVELGLTNEQVLERLERYSWPDGIKPPKLATVGHWLNGTRRPRKMEHLRAMCEVLDLSLDDAVKGSPKEAKTATQQLMLESMESMSDADAEILLAMAMRMRKSR